MLTPDPLNPLFSVQTGAINVKGFELEAKVSLSRELDVVAGYSHLIPKVRQATTRLSEITYPTSGLIRRQCGGCTPSGPVRLEDSVSAAVFDTSPTTMLITAPASSSRQ